MAEARGYDWSLVIRNLQGQKLAIVEYNANGTLISTTNSALEATIRATSIFSDMINHNFDQYLDIGVEDNEDVTVITARRAKIATELAKLTAGQRNNVRIITILHWLANKPVYALYYQGNIVVISSRT